LYVIPVVYMWLSDKSTDVSNVDINQN
jgi:hypothetical protein